jgi:hypothetical protein
VKKTAGNFGTKNLGGLNAGTGYEWKVRTLCGLNPKDWSKWSPKIPFTTLSPARYSAAPGNPVAGSGLDIRVSPIPAGDFLEVTLSGQAAYPARLCLFDLQGRRILSADMAEPVVTIETGPVSPGLYLVVVTAGRQVASARVFIRSMQDR